MKKPKFNGMTIAGRNAVTGYLFFSPWIIGFFAFTLYPVIYSIALSLNTVQIKTGNVVMRWAGLSFYNQSLNIDTDFKISLGNTLLLIGCATPVVLVFSLIIALLLNNKFPARTFFRSVFFLPVIIMSGPVVSKLLTKYTMNFSDNVPQIYSFLSNMPEIISTPCLFILNNLVLILWFSGVQILIFLAGLQKINPNLYEAAEIDGAGKWEKFWKITLPHIMPLAQICAVYTVIDVANYSDNAMNVKISRHLFETNQIYSFSAAMSWIYFAAVMLLLLIIYGLFYVFGRRNRQ